MAEAFGNFEHVPDLDEPNHGANGARKQRQIYRLVPFAQLRPDTRSAYMVRGILPRAGLVAVWGSPKCGKSFFTFDLVMHVALGWPYRGRKVHGGPVVYCAFEGAEGFKSRAEAFRRTHPVNDDVPFFLLASNAKLVRDHQALIGAISSQIGPI